MRVSGLATGMDTETIIRDLMNANRIPLDKITQKKQYLQWQLDDYRATNRKLFDFSQKTLDTMILSTSFTQKTVSVSSPDDVAIKNMSSTSDFAGTLQIHQLAKNATMQSADKVGGPAGGPAGMPAGMSVDSKLSDLGAEFTFDADGFTSITINAPGMKEPVTRVFSKDDSLSAVLVDINSNTGVNAFYDEHTGKIALTAKSSGKGNILDGKISVEGSLGDSLKLTGTNDTSKAGVNAEFTLNGLKTERESNTFQINGFEMTLKQVTGDPDDPATPGIVGKTITFSSAPDTEKIFDSVVKYIDEYNKLIEDLNKQVREPKYRDFHALSAEQKKGMTDKDIELWEEKAQSGTLRNDSDITSMLSKMRTALMGAVGENGMTLKDIGITTSKNYLDNGKLVINETDLKKAINDDPNKVHELFAKDGGTNAAENGFARRLRMIVDDSQKVIAKRAGKVGDVNDTFTLGRNMKDMDKQIERFEERLLQVESRLWKQFNAMESAIQRLNAQSASLMSSFGG